MANTDEKVMTLVEKELARNPDIGVEELREKATKVNPDVGALTLRQFNARYPLQVKRRQSQKSEGIAQTVVKAVERTRKAAASRARRTRKKVTEPATAPAAAPAPTAPKPADREAIAKVLHRFAQDLTAAGDDVHKVVTMMGNMDKYVDQVVKAIS